MELYFWAFVLAILIFAFGTGVSIYEGLHKLSAPSRVENPMVNYIVLSIVMVFEAGVWWIAYKEFKVIKGRQGLVQAIRDAKDPTVVTVLFEDTAAMAGLIVAFVAIALAQLLGVPGIDALASILIGLILAVTAALLAYESKGLLIGEAASPGTISEIEAAISEQGRVLRVNEMLTMHMGPKDVLVNLSLNF